MRFVNFCLLVSFVILSIVANPVDAGTISWEAEISKGEKGLIEVLKAPFRTTDSNGVDYEISEASGGKFVGVPNGPGNFSSSWLKYMFNVPAEGDWYFWARGIAPTGADNSFLWGLDIADADAAAPDDNNPEHNIWDLHEQGNFPLGGEANDPNRDDKVWVWFRLSSRSGPFPGGGAVYDNPPPMPLTAGNHTLHLIHREDGVFIDWFFATTDKAFDANKTAPEPKAVKSRGKLAATWGRLKRVR